MDKMSRTLLAEKGQGGHPGTLWIWMESVGGGTPESRLAKQAKARPQGPQT